MRRLGSSPNGYVRTMPDDLIVVAYEKDKLVMSRADARLLAKRINRCLDETRL